MAKWSDPICVLVLCWMLSSLYFYVLLLVIVDVIERRLGRK